MTPTSTTIRVSRAQRDRLRALAADSGATMSDTFDAALESLRRDRFYRTMDAAESSAAGGIESGSEPWHVFAAERDEWLNADLG